jgi:hypothetical protein
MIRIVKRKRYQFDTGHRAITRPWHPPRGNSCSIEFLFVLEQRIADRRFRRRVIRSGIMWRGNSRVPGFLESHNLVQQGNRQVHRDGDPADPGRTCHRKYIQKMTATARRSFWPPSAAGTCPEVRARLGATPTAVETDRGMSDGCKSAN